MRMVMLLIVLAIIGLTLTRWLGHKPPPPPVSQATSDHAAPPAATLGDRGPATQTPSYDGRHTWRLDVHMP